MLPGCSTEPPQRAVDAAEPTDITALLFVMVEVFEGED